jgi:hypothetical protein
MISVLNWLSLREKLGLVLGAAAIAQIICQSSASFAQPTPEQLTNSTTPPTLTPNTQSKSENEDEIEITVIERILNQPIYAPFRREGVLRDSTRPAYVVTKYVLSYNCTQSNWILSTFAWGWVMLAGAMLATFLAPTRFFRYPKDVLGYLIQSRIVLIAGYLIYELVIWIAGFGLGGASSFTLTILWQIFIGNASWAITLMIIHSILVGCVIRREKVNAN